MRARFPERGQSWDALEQAMDRMAEDDIDWRHGRAPLYVFGATEEVYEVGRRAYMKFFNENALGSRRAFFGLKQMEDEVVDMGLDLFQAPAGSSGHMTSGGSESIFLAVKAARSWFRANHDRQGPLNVVAPYSAHPAFNKAAEVMDLEVRRVPLGPDLRADPAAMEAAADQGTIMLVGSAPCFPHGVIDPIEAIGAVAQGRRLWFHVDACVGGYLAPFVRKLGRAVRAFDFSVAEVRSLSADLHKFGFCPKPASTLFYRYAEDQTRQSFDFTDWPNGRFTTPTLVGTRPGGAVAAAWAVLRHLGEAGYKDIAARLLRMTGDYVAGIREVEGLQLLAEPDLTIVNFGSEAVDVFAVAEALRQRGWLPGLTQQPRGLHLMLSLLHEPARGAYLSDLRDCVAAVRAEGNRAAPGITATY